MEQCTDTCIKRYQEPHKFFYLQLTGKPPTNLGKNTIRKLTKSKAEPVLPQSSTSVLNIKLGNAVVTSLQNSNRFVEDHKAKGYLRLKS